jgi:AcrR family transcriptional regulator
MGGVNTGSNSAGGPRRGRPRSSHVDAAILTSALEVVGEVGITGMSMDQLAERAGVSKATIYRRWASKEQLVLDALQSAMSPLDDVDTGSLLGDLRLYLAELVERTAAGGMRDVLPHLIEVACHDQGVRSALDEYVQYRRRPLRAIFRRAIDRGELPGTTDIDVLIDIVVGPFVYRRLLTGGPLDADFVERLLGVVVLGTARILPVAP